ncbi:MAG: hypothetical protein TR69_WS6001000869 [candidate division WS6 bacterium OLB20]|uniref:Glycosyltransferase RgtA/B/C/D-like domain-containing protein n=1 Tax=candidate division WS6 bacterium OLB20 TaxID=1617426 RepID=A0A136LYW2_9BACT|nr:MAG: hypothetical protein TR69_WS6001000869 [candidate division WS6 bacterium OLB20]
MKTPPSGRARFVVRHRLFFAAAAVLVLLRIPSLFEPHWYLDEGMYATIGAHIRDGHVLYRDIYDHKPQLIFYLYALLSLTGNTLVAAKVLNILAGIVTLGGIYALSRRRFLFGRRATAVALVAATILLGTPVLEGNIANAENFFLPLTVWGLYLGLTRSSRGLLLAGLLFGIAFHIKLHPLFDLGALAVYLLITADSNKERIRQTGLLALGFVAPAVAFILFELSRGTFDLYIAAAYLDAYAYSGESAESYIQQTLTKIVVLLTGLTAAVTVWRKTHNRTVTFILILLMFEVFAAVLSGRVFYHYLLQLVPGVSLGAAWVYRNLFRDRSPADKVTAAAVAAGLMFVFAAYFNSSYALPYQNPNRRLPDSWFAAEYYNNFARHLPSGFADDSYLLFFSDRPLKLRSIRNVLPEDTSSVYIYSDLGWAYDYVDQHSPTRIFVAFQLYYRNDDRDRLATMDELYQDPPQYLMIDETRDTFDQLDTFLAENYRQSGRENEFVLYTYTARATARAR